MLCIYIGGTIGMRLTEQGWEPERGLLTKLLLSTPKFHDPTSQGGPAVGGVMPLSQWGKRVSWVIDEAETLLDSSNMDQDDWLGVARVIRDHYALFDGFVLIQGTDTLAYTASSLSFLLKYLGKTVVVTGSQVPMVMQPNDAEANLFGAINIAAHFEIPEVCVFFNGSLTRGNRTTKFDASSYTAFVSHNFPELGTYNAEVKINWALVRSEADVEHRKYAFRIAERLCAHVATVRLFPGITASFLNKCLEPPLRGCVVLTYGQGNINMRVGHIADALKRAADRGVLLVNITQCPKGAVTSSYATGKALLDLGVESGHDMTVEAALSKLAFLLGEVDSGVMTLDHARQLISRPLRGELTAPLQVQKFSFRDGNFVEALVLALEQVITVKDATDNQSSNRAGIANALFSMVAQFGDASALEALVRAGASVDTCDADGRTAVHVAAMNKGRMAMLRFLIEVAKANVNVLDQSPAPGPIPGLAPLDHAILCGNREAEQLLREHGAKQAFELKEQGVPSPFTRRI